MVETLAELIEECLSTGDYGSVYSILTKPEYKESIKDEGMELIQKISELGILCASEKEHVLSDSLVFICNLVNPKIGLLSVLEQMEAFMYSPKFTMFFPVLLSIVKQHKSKRSSVYSWVLELLNKHLRLFCKFPQEIHEKLIENNGIVLNEQLEQIQSTIEYFNQLLTVYDLMVQEYLQDKVEGTPDTNELLKQEGYIVKFILDLLGIPLVYFDLTYFAANGRKSLVTLDVRSNRCIVLRKFSTKRTQGRLIAERLMNHICKINSDPSYIFDLASERSKRIKEEVVSELDEDDDAFQIQNISIANYFYLIYVENLGVYQIPMVYKPCHVFQVLLPSIIHLLSDSFKNELVIEKGLMLADKILSFQDQNLHSRYVTEVQYTPFMDSLAEIIVYSKFKSNRQFALNVLKTFFWCLEPSAKSIFLKYNLSNITHSGLRGFLIGEIKECVDLSLSTNPESLDMQKYFLRDNFIKFFNEISLQDSCLQGSDLAEKCDEIIPILNLLRYLILRDRTNHKCGILAKLRQIEDEFLKPIRIALNLSKANYHQIVRELKEKDTSSEASLESKINTEITINDEEFDMEEPSVKEQLESINAIFLQLDIVESLLARIDECIRN